MLKVVKTENGAVRGLPGNNTRISVFKGIPFAAPPVGENRWRAPQPAADWEGVRDCYTFGPISVQDTPGLGTDIYCREWHVDPEIPMDEDCLYLNVWTNAKSDTDRLPVYVWFFGGGFQWGYPPEMEFNGENIAKRGVVVVSVNYRLGAFGFISHPEITKESPEAPTNFGNLDQQAGLKWVIRNIAAFGGDPQNITIGGQSAGGGSVMNHLTSPQSIGLFQKAIVHSGMIRSPYELDGFITPKPLAKAEETGEAFFEYLGVKTLAEARALDAMFIRDKYGEFAQTHPRFAPTIDGRFMVADPYVLFLQGKHANVPMISGNTGDEFKAFIFADDEETFAEKAKKALGDKYDEFMSFPEAHARNGKLFAPVDSLECAVKAAFAHNEAPSYYYNFNPDIPGWDNPGTFHSVDLWFFFETLAACWRPFKGYHFDLARMMCNYLTNFVKSGDPNGRDADGTDMPVWRPYGTGAHCGMNFLKEGCVPSFENTPFNDFMIGVITDQTIPERKQAYNPYLPNWEYIPDGEPYVFGDRVYVYGSHDQFNGYVFCQGDYVCWSAPVNDLGNWRYEGVTYKKTQDPVNFRGNMVLYAPDVTVGPDGRYYLYYVLDKVGIVSVAVCDTPAGKYEFYGYVHYADGTRLGEREGDEPQFDPGVLTEGDTTYLFTGFCGRGDKSRHGSQLTVLAPDMLTIVKEPRIVVPGSCYSEGTGFEGHAFFEASSIRKFDGKYYFIYSSEVMHELCYATSDSPEGPFAYGGVIVSNSDFHIGTYKDAETPAAYGANNHGSLIEIAGKRYIFYHRQTNATWYSRQGCAEEVKFAADGSIAQAEITSCGLNGGPLRDTEELPAHIACNLFDTEITQPMHWLVGIGNQPRITQDGRDGDKNPSYVANIHEGTTIGFKYIAFKGVKEIELTVRGYIHDTFEVRTEIGGPVVGTVRVDSSDIWEKYRAACPIPDGVSALYLTKVGGGNGHLLSVRFIH